MALFMKKEKVSFYDEKTGERLFEPKHEVSKPLIHLPERKSKSPTYDALMEQYYKEHPEKTKTAKVKKAAVGLGKRLDSWSKNYSKKQGKSGPMFTWNPPPSRGGGKPPLALDIFNFGTPGGTSRKKRGKSTGGKYIIRGGMAYKVAKTGKSKGKRKKAGGKKKHDFNDPFDFPDFRW